MPIRLLQEYRVTPATKLPSPQKLQESDRQVRDPVKVSNYLSTSPFGTMDVWPSVNGATIITWEQNRHFKGQIAQDAVLVLEFNYQQSTVDGWITVSEQPLTYYLEDRVNRHRGQSIGGSYRLRIVSEGEEYISDRVNLFSKLSFTEYRTALRILRAENRQLYHKTAGYLLKRRWLGTRCTNCDNHLIHNAEKEQCPVCYATGFVGGYFAPVQCAMEIGVAGSSDVVDQTRGPVNDGHTQGRLTAVYMPEMNDVWVNSVDGVRWRVQGHNIIAQMRTVPLVLQCQLMSIPGSDIVYSLHKEI